MKDFDEFHSWIEFEKRYLNGHQKQLLFVTILFSALTRMFPKPTFAP